jgi:hypothetical protein
MHEFAWAESTILILISPASVWLKLLLSGGEGVSDDLLQSVPAAETIPCAMSSCLVEYETLRARDHRQVRNATVHVFVRSLRARRSVRFNSIAYRRGFERLSFV